MNYCAHEVTKENQEIVIFVFVAPIGNLNFRLKNSINRS